MYKISFDYNRQEFDAQYPLLLQERGVDAYEFQQTVQQCTLLCQQVYKPLRRASLLFMLFTFVSLFLALLLMLVPFLILMTTSRIYHYAFSFPVIMIFWVIMTVACSVRIARMNRRAPQKIQQTLQPFLSSENQQKYFPKGIQILLRFEVQFVYERRGLQRIEVPCLELLFSHSAPTSAPLPGGDIISYGAPVATTTTVGFSNPYYTQTAPQPAFTGHSNFAPAVFTEIAANEESAFEPMFPSQNATYVNYQPTSSQFYTKQ